jgi:hypothetical protein
MVDEGQRQQWDNSRKIGHRTCPSPFTDPCSRPSLVVKHKELLGLGPPLRRYSRTSKMTSDQVGCGGRLAVVELD